MANNMNIDGPCMDCFLEGSVRAPIVPKVEVSRYVVRGREIVKRVTTTVEVVTERVILCEVRKFTIDIL